MRAALLIALLVVGGCRENKPPAPTADQADQLNDADSMLNSLANEEGPEAKAPDPSNHSN